MTGLSAGAYVAIFLGAAALTLVLVPVALRAAVRWGVLDHPGERKHQRDPVPYLGGVAIVVAFAVAVLAAAWVRPPDAGLLELVLIMGAGVLVSVLGLVDDLRGVGVGTRLGVVAGSAVVLAVAEVRVDLFDLGLLDVLVTVVWIVGITNAFNLLDNMDGLSAGVAGIAAGWFALIASLQGQFLVAALSVALAGCALGFLRSNLHPARIYMGDAGSLFLGFLLAVLGIKVTVPTDPVLASAVPILVVGVAVLDTTLVTVTRIRAGRSPFEGGQDHVSHRLLRLGCSVPSAVSSVYGLAVVTGASALLVAELEVLPARWGIAAAAVVVLAVAGILLARVPVHRDAGRRLSARR